MKRKRRDMVHLPCYKPRFIHHNLCGFTYFAWNETQALVQRIRSTLRPGGILLCRLNSTEDHNFGASGHTELEPNLFLVEGNPKRFFDKASVELLFGEGWNTLSMEHYVTSKYVKPKALWEIVLERSDA
ncbi:MAG: hypothetical protein M1154_00035 [Gammaproteobacteria bacterium]|nr:hypothetical protein [Gammaproteobacteria bacterium]